MFKRLCRSSFKPSMEGPLKRIKLYENTEVYVHVISRVYTLTFMYV